MCTLNGGIAVGRDVWHLEPGQRVMLSSHVVARENVDDPAQILMGLTSIGAGAERMLTDWPDGTLAEYALVLRAGGGGRVRASRCRRE